MRGNQVQYEYASCDDTFLMTLLKAGDNCAYTEIYTRYEKLLFIHAYKRLKDGDAAWDMIQDIFVNLWERRSEIQVIGSLRAYLFVSVRYKIFNYISRQNNKDIYIESIKNFAPKYEAVTDYAIRHKQLLTMIEKEIAALPPKMRRVFELSRDEQLTHKEIANRLNISESTAKNHVKGALKILKTKLGPLFFFLL